MPDSESRCLRLPASVGVIFTGVAFSYFPQAEIFFARDVLQELAFFLVLLTAGLEIRLHDLKPYIFAMALLPATCELLAIAAYAQLVMQFTVAEALVLGTVLVSIGDGLVIPKMKEFMAEFPEHPVPRLVFTWAPLEASFVLTLFGTLVGLSAPASQPTINFSLEILANVLRIVATVLAGAVLGTASGWLIPRRTQLQIRGKQIFTGSCVESFLMVLAVALCAFGIGAGDAGKELVPMGFSAGSLFQPELLVIVMGTCFAAVAELQVLRDVDTVMGGVWVFGQLVLFSMLGSRTTPNILPQLTHVLPVIFVGLVFRLAGIFLAIGLSLLTGASGHPFQRETLVPDALFCFLSTIPRATIQGALGSVPVSQRFFQHFPQKSHAQNFIFTAARLYIVCMSICGMTLLNTFGPRLCNATASRLHQLPAKADDALLSVEAPSPSPEVDRVTDALELLAERFSVSREAVLSALRALPSCAHEAELTTQELVALPARTVSEPIVAKDANQPTGSKEPAVGGHAKGSHTKSKGASGKKPQLQRQFTRGLALAQFECSPSVMKRSTQLEEPSLDA